MRALGTFLGNAFVFALCKTVKCAPSTSPTDRGTPRDTFVRNLVAGDNKREVQSVSADPINVATGEFFIEEVDLSFPGLGVPYQLKRTYRSRIDFDGPLGENWDHNLNQRIFVTPPSVSGCGDRVEFMTGEGTKLPFTLKPGGAVLVKEYLSSFGAQIKLTWSPLGWTMVSADGTIRQFDSQGSLTSITDANKVGLQLKWAQDSSARQWHVSSVTDSENRPRLLGDLVARRGDVAVAADDDREGLGAGARRTEAWGTHWPDARNHLPGQYRRGERACDLPAPAPQSSVHAGGDTVTPRASVPGSQNVGDAHDELEAQLAQALLEGADVRERLVVRFVQAPQLEPQRLAEGFRVLLGHLSLVHEIHVAVDLGLELLEPFEGGLPGAGLEHIEHERVELGVVADEVDDEWVVDAALGSHRRRKNYHNAVRRRWPERAPLRQGYRHGSTWLRFVATGVCRGGLGGEAGAAMMSVQTEGPKDPRSGLPAGLIGTQQGTPRFPKQRSSRLVFAVSAMLVALLSTPPQLRAADANVEHTMVMIGLERVLGFTTWRVKDERGDLVQNRTEFGLTLSPASQPYALPRLGLDLAVFRGFTVGGSVGLYFGRTQFQSSSEPHEQSPISFLTVLAAPRLGHLWRISRALSFWGRAGVTYSRKFDHKASDFAPGSETNVTDWDLAVTVEPTLLIAPFEKFAFTVSGLCDWPIAGGTDVESVSATRSDVMSYDHSLRDFGLMAGMLLRL